MLDEIAHDWIQINYDPANLICFAGVAPDEDVAFALQRLGHVHLKDKRGGMGVSDLPLLGAGQLDLAGFLRRLQKIDFAGPSQWRPSSKIGSGRPRRTASKSPFGAGSIRMS